ncbi:MAG: hypothetical protein MHPDNHAH_00432 [Anaerolineales bacterium]|nr:hypothetical protein [Anaerolineales bacterium]
MKMQIEFFSKDEFAIQMDFSGRYPFPETETSELFLFTCFVLRQLHNLGPHLVAKALSGLLVSEKRVSDLLQNKYEPLSGIQLLRYLKIYALSLVSLEESVKLASVLDNELSFNDAMIKILDTEFLAKIPKLVSYSGKGKKSFEMTLPPFQLNHKGFGFFGKDVTYYAFHSVTGLIQYLGQKHGEDEIFCKHLVQAAKLCGSAYIQKQIPPDQVALTNTILKQIGIS